MRRRSCSQFLAIALALGATVLVSHAAAHQTLNAVVVAVPGQSGKEPAPLEDLHKWIAWLLANGFAVDRCGHDPATGTIVVDLTDPDQGKALEEAGFTIVSMLRPSNNEQGPQPEYLDHLEIAALLAKTAADYPSITRLFTVGVTFEGRPILALEVSNRPGVPEDKPAIQFNGQHHSRELVTPHIVMDVIQHLTEGFGSDPQITQWVQDYKTVCVPIVNPDGVNHVWNVYSLWRRNRRVYPNCTGVDLNRNYPYLWGPGCGSSGNCNDIYRGPAPASELETQGMIALANQFNFTMAVSYHSYGRFIDYPYACSDGSTSGQMPEHAVIHEMMHGMADAIAAVDGVQYQVYSPTPFGGVNGDDTSWYYAHRGTYAFILEVGTSFEPPFSEALNIVNRNRGGWKYLYERLGQARIDVYVTYQCSGQPLAAEVTLPELNFDTGELPRHTTQPFGRWTYMVPPNGTYTLQASLPGLAPKQLTVSVGNSPAVARIALGAADECPADPIPAASSWGLAMLLLGILSAGTVVLRRAQRHQA